MGFYLQLQQERICLFSEGGNRAAEKEVTENRVQISGYRYYSPRLGRWINRDPIGENMTLNLLIFHNNNLIQYIDPFGLLPFFPEENYVTCQRDSSTPMSDSGWKFISIAPVGAEIPATGFLFASEKAKISYVRIKIDPLICCCNNPGHRKRTFKYKWERTYLYEVVVLPEAVTDGSHFFFYKKGFELWPPTDWTDFIVSLILDQIDFDYLQEDGNRKRKMKEENQPLNDERGILIFNSGLPDSHRSCPICAE
jgi:RHS repeat-associated protein